MTDTTAPDTTTESPADRPPERTRSAGGPAVGPNDIWRTLGWIALAVCSLLAVFAVVQFYGSVTEAIDLWVEPRHRPLMHAAFNLIVLLGSLVGISLLVRELS